MSVPAYILRALQTLMPPESITPSEWAEKYRRLDTKTSARPGPWHNATTPYLVGIMDALIEPQIEKIVFCKPTQCGGTEALMNMLGYVISNDPNPSMIVYPSDDLAKQISNERLQPMFRLCQPLRDKFNENSAALELQFTDMFLRLAGSNSPADLASFAEKNLFLDEVDKFAGASKKEADAISLAIERTKTYPGSKVYITSTPTIKTGQIWTHKEGCDEERHYFIPCPHCGEMIELKFAQLRWDGEEVGGINDRAETARYCCQICGCIFGDAEKIEAVRHGEWRAIRKGSRVSQSVAFWINTLYSPFVRFRDIARKWMLAQGDPEALQNFINSWLAEPWEDTKLKTDADLVRERQTDLPEMTVPTWAKMLVGGVDVQEQSLYYVVRAFGDHITSQLVTRGQAWDWASIEQVMNTEYQKENGQSMIVELCLVDSGDQTDSVYDFVAQNSDWALPCKGASGDMQSHFKISKVNKELSSAYGMPLVFVDGNRYKDMIAGRMLRENGQGAWMVFRDIDDVYCSQVTAEHKVTEKSGGKVVSKWIPKASHIDNHYLDCEVYAMAAADIKGVRYLFLEAEQDQKEEKPQEQPTQWPQQNGFLTDAMSFWR